MVQEGKGDLGSRGSRFRIWSLGFGVWGLGFRVQGLGFGVYRVGDLELKI